MLQTENYMNNNQENHFKSILIELKNTTLNDIFLAKSQIKKETGITKHVDAAIQRNELMRELTVIDRKYKLIKKFENALKLISEHDYGYCAKCGEEIGIPRLEAYPTATLCIECKEADECRAQNSVIEENALEPETLALLNAYHFDSNLDRSEHADQWSVAKKALNISDEACVRPKNSKIENSSQEELQYWKFMDDFSEHLKKENINSFYQFGPLSSDYWSQKYRILMINAEAYAKPYPNDIEELNIKYINKKWRNENNKLSKTTIGSMSFACRLFKYLGVYDFNNDESSKLDALAKCAYINFRLTWNDKYDDFGNKITKLDNHGIWKELKITESWLRKQVEKLSPHAIVIGGAANCDFFNVCFFQGDKNNKDWFISKGFAKKIKSGNPEFRNYNNAIVFPWVHPSRAYRDIINKSAFMLAEKLKYHSIS